jgi:hypothetical protein
MHARIPLLHTLKACTGGPVVNVWRRDLLQDPAGDADSPQPEGAVPDLEVDLVRELELLAQRNSVQRVVVERELSQVRKRNQRPSRREGPRRVLEQGFVIADRVQRELDE